MSAPAVLDGARIRRRRQQLALSERDVATHLGTTSSAVRSLELGTNHDTLTATYLTALAQLLGMTPSELFTTTAPTAVAATDVQIVGALLTEAGRRVPISALAQACGWDLEHTHQVLDALADTLVPVGQMLQRTPDLVGVAPSMSAADPTQVRDLLRVTHARSGMNLRTATTLHRVFAGTLTGAESDNTTRVALGELVNAGLLTHDAGDRGTRPALHPDVDLLQDVDG
jgi:transcriptional regulator with XRE-family HTH domain